MNDTFPFFYPSKQAGHTDSPETDMKQNKFVRKRNYASLYPLLSGCRNRPINMLMLGYLIPYVEDLRAFYGSGH